MAIPSSAALSERSAIGEPQRHRLPPAPIPVPGRAAGLEPSASPPAGSRNFDRIATKRILWIDDEPDLMQPFAAFLRGEAGFDVEFAVTGQAGLEQARLNQHHMILLDLRLPDAQGLDLLPALLQLAAAVPIIVITSFGSLELARRAGVLGAAGFVSKPMRPADLLTSIRETLDSVEGPRPKSVAEERSTGRPLLTRRVCFSWSCGKQNTPFDA